MTRVGNEIELTVDDVAHGGWCVGRLDDQVVFVRHALPGERVRVRVTEQTTRFLRGEAVEILTASPDRVEALCIASASPRNQRCVCWMARSPTLLLRRASRINATRSTRYPSHPPSLPDPPTAS